MAKRHCIVYLAAVALQAGSFYTLDIRSEASFGVLLGEEGVPLPRSQVPPNSAVGDLVDVFVHGDPEGKLVATTKRPKAIVGEFAHLRVVDRFDHGVFMDWGLDKDLFVPTSEQERPMMIGRSYVVAVTVDRQNRVMASSRVIEFLDPNIAKLRVGTAVSAMVYDIHELGLKVIVDGRHAGLIYSDDIYQNLAIGDVVQGFISDVRDDGKLDIRLRARGVEALDADRVRLLEALERSAGYLPLHDKSSPQAISQALGLSKKAFKRALGGLLKSSRVTIEDQGIRLRDAATPDAAQQRPTRDPGP